MGVRLVAQDTRPRINEIASGNAAKHPAHCGSRADSPITVILSPGPPISESQREINSVFYISVQTLIPVIMQLGNGVTLTQYQLLSRFIQLL